MKARAFRSGEVTAFLALIFILLISFSGSIMESASLQAAKSYRRADMNRAMESVFAEYQRELLEKFDIFALEGSYESGIYDEQKIADRMAYYGASNIQQDFTRVELLTDQNGKPFLEQIGKYIENKYGLSSLNNLQLELNGWEEREKETDQFQSIEEEADRQLSGILQENELELPAEDNPLPNIQDLSAAPLTDLVMPKDGEVSEKTVAIEEMVSGRRLREGRGDFSDVAGDVKVSSIAFGEYVLTHFSSAVPEEGEESQGALEYELEYILSGKDSDKDNLEAVLKKLVLLRFVPNYVYLQQDPAKQAEAEGLALALCTAVAFPAAAGALAQVLLLAWAFGESIMDLRTLMKGGGVALVKGADDWQLSLSGLMTLGTKEDYQEGKDQAGGLKYRDYLRGLLFLGDKENMSLRALDMIELCLRHEKGLSWFRADHCISRMEVESSVSMRRGITYRFRTYYGYR